MDYYAKEYYHSLKCLKNKINNGNLLVSQKEKYIKILNTINNNVTSKKITYLKALVSLIHLEKEIDKYQQGYVASIIAKDYEERTFEGKFIEYDFKTRKETEEIEKGSSEPIDISLYKEVLKNFNYISEDDFIEFNLSSKEDEIKEEKKEEKELKKEIDEELYKEIEENITTNIKKEIIKNRRKTKKEKSNSTDELKQIKDNITTTLKEIKTSDILSNRSKIKIITYLTILSVLTSVPIFAFNKYKNISKEREYKTTKEIYTMMEPVEVEDEDNYEEVLGMGIPKKPLP